MEQEDSAASLSFCYRRFDNPDLFGYNYQEKMIISKE